SSRRRHTRWPRDWSSDVCSSDLSFNTAQFNPTTGAPALKNGQCTVSGFATTTAGTQSAINTTSFTLNNLDMAVVTVSSTNSATRSEERRVGNDGSGGSARRQCEK